MECLLNNDEYNYKKVVENIENCCINNNLPNVELCAATKTISFQRINNLVQFGLKSIGENRVNEIKEKKEFYDKNLHLDFIGTLQTNKISYLLKNVNRIQSLCTLGAVVELDRVCRINNISCDCLVEINSSDETNKSGLPFDELEDFLSFVSKYKTINVKGLMTIGSSEDISCKCFEKTKKTFDKIAKFEYDNIDMEILSMGMSNNYIEAIKCGSTLVRPGRAIFGERKNK